MDNRYQMIYEMANLENLEKQIQSGYFTEAVLNKILSERQISESEYRLITNYKPEFAKIIEEAAPVGVLSNFKTWAMGKSPLASHQATAQGRKDFARQANNLKNQFLRYISSIGKKINSSSKRDLVSFLHQQGYDVSKISSLNKLLKRSADPLSEQIVNEIILGAITSQNSAPSPQPPTLPTSTAAASATPTPAPVGNLNQKQVLALASVLNKTTGKNIWGYANTVGLIKRLKQAGVNISV